MRFRRPKLTFLLDESVPDAVGAVLRAAGHKVLHVNKGTVVPRRSSDAQVALVAILNNAILVAIDADMRSMARGHAIGAGRYARLNLLQLSCSEIEAASRVKASLSLIEHEWVVGAGSTGRRLFVEIGASVIRTNR